MNNAFNSNFDVMQFIQTVSKTNDKILRDLFKSRINGSFLIKIKSAVLKKLGNDLLNYYYVIPFDDSKIVTGREETPEYDICRLIVGIHRHHSIFLSEEELYRNQKNIEYQEQIVNEVIEKIRLRKFGSIFFRRKQLLLGDEFLYFPIPYELFVMSMKSICLMNGNVHPSFANYRHLVEYALSSLTLMENNLLSDAYPLCRAMIELYMKTLILQKHPEARETYEKFCSFEIEQSCCRQSYPEKFIALYDKRKHFTLKSKVDYLHYGWLDTINDYNTEITNKYSIYGIQDYLLDNCVQKHELNQIKTLYQMCHGYTHGSVVGVKYPLLQYFEISTIIYYGIRFVFSEIYKDLKIEMTDEDKVLLSILKRDFKKMEDQYTRRSTENFELYYSLN